MITREDLANRFTHHAPTGNQAERYEHIRAAAFEFAEYLIEVTPSSREQSLAVTKLEEVVFWANAAIARNEVGVPGDVTDPAPIPGADEER